MFVSSIFVLRRTFHRAEEGLERVQARFPQLLERIEPVADVLERLVPQVGEEESSIAAGSAITSRNASK